MAMLACVMHGQWFRVCPARGRRDTAGGRQRPMRQEIVRRGGDAPPHLTPAPSPRAAAWLTPTVRPVSPTVRPGWAGLVTFVGPRGPAISKGKEKVQVVKTVSGNGTVYAPPTWSCIARSGSWTTMAPSRLPGPRLSAPKMRRAPWSRVF